MVKKYKSNNSLSFSWSTCKFRAGVWKSNANQRAYYTNGVTRQEQTRKTSNSHLTQELCVLAGVEGGGEQSVTVAVNKLM